MEVLAKDETIAGELSQLATAKGPVSDTLAQGHYPSVLTYYRARGAIHALVENGPKQDYWIVKRGEFQRGVTSGVFSRLQFEKEYHEFLE